MSIQSMGELGKDFCPNFLQPFLENIDRRSCNDGNREHIPVFHSSSRTKENWGKNYPCRPRLLPTLEGNVKLDRTLKVKSWTKPI